MEFAATVMLTAIVLYLFTRPKTSLPRARPTDNDPSPGSHRQRLDRTGPHCGSTRARCGPCDDAPGE